MYRAGAILFAAAFAAASSVTGASGGTAAGAETSTRADKCPGNPGALGTSRVLVLKPGEYSRVGTMQYKDTLPLADKEVVITFDDGPLPPYSNKILDILTAQCVKATYFIIGTMARAFPDVVRREREAGYTIGTHSESHPTRFERLTGDKLDFQIDRGIADVGAALGDPAAVAPFFRIPGLGRSAAVEDALAERSLVVFSADVVADDWHRHISPSQIIARAMSRLEKRGKGILLLHDIHPRTVAALPGLLKDLKEHGFHVVQVVPAAPAVPAGTLVAGQAKPARRVLASAIPLAEDFDGASGQTWPQPDTNVAAADVTLAAPDAAVFEIDDPNESGFAADTIADWPNVTAAAVLSAAALLAAPNPQDSGISLQGQKVVGPGLGPRSSLSIAEPAAHARIHHIRMHARRPLRRRGAEGQHAELLGSRSVAALQTPVH